MNNVYYLPDRKIEPQASEIEKAIGMGGMEYLKSLCKKGGLEYGIYLLGAIHFARGELQAELYFLHTNWFLKGE